MSLWSKSICKVKKTRNIFSSENILVYSYDANFLQEESSFYDFIKNIRGYRYTSWPILGETGPVPESKFSVQPWMFETEKKGPISTGFERNLCTANGFIFYETLEFASAWYQVFFRIIKPAGLKSFRPLRLQLQFWRKYYKKYKSFESTL